MTEFRGGWNAAVYECVDGIVYAQVEIDGQPFDIELPIAAFPEPERQHIQPGRYFYLPLDQIEFRRE